jgi:hypothetical protein
MALVATRVEIQHLKDLPDASDFGYGIGDILIETGYWDHPFLGTKVSLLIYQIRSSMNANGRELSREVDEFHYEQATEFPVSARKETWQYAWIPRVNHRASLLKVQEEYTFYWYENGMVGGSPSFRKVTDGYVVYNLAPTSYLIDGDGAAALDAKGQKIPNGPIRNVPGTQRAWSAAITQQGIVEKPDENQRAYWERIKLEQEIVTEDMQRILRWGFTHDYLTGHTESRGPEQTLKDPLTWSYPLKPAAPVLAGTPSPARVTLEIKGGDAAIQYSWPKEWKQQCRPDSYVIFRKQTAFPPPAFTTDRFGLYEEEQPPADETTTTLEVTDSQDYGGVPKSALPPQTSYSETEDPTPAPQPSWDEIDEIPQAVTTDGQESAAIYFDTQVDAQAQYEYYVIAKLGQESSPESNHVKVTCPGGMTTSSALMLPLVTVLADGTTEVDVRAPEELGLSSLDDFPSFGESEVYDVPAKLNVDNDAQGWTSATLKGAKEIAKAISMRNFMRDTERMIGSLETAPLLMLERGQLCGVPPMEHDIWGNALHLTVEMHKRDWRIEGYSIKAARVSGGGFESTHTVELEEQVI